MAWSVEDGHDEHYYCDKGKVSGQTSHSIAVNLGITKNLSSQSQRLAKVPAKMFEAKITAGERRPSAFIRTKVTTIKDPLGAFVQTLLPLRKNPVAYYADLVSGIQDERDALDLCNKCFDAIDRISAAVDALEVRFPNFERNA
jgi:hypothetical protein